MNDLSCKNEFIQFDTHISENSSQIKKVLWLNLLVMGLEIYFGILSGSMALLADGWHMATHAAALGISLLTYKLATHPKMSKNFNFGGGKIIALGGFTSSLFLLAIAGFVLVESIFRFFKPENIHFSEALTVATIGLVVNFIGAYLLRPRDNFSDQQSLSKHDSNHGHHSHSGSDRHHSHHHHSHSGHSDSNIKAAYIHIVADALTSIAAIVALVAGLYFDANWLDSAVGALSSLVIFKWAIGLIKETGWELLDGHASEINFSELKKKITDSGYEIIDLHVWRVGPSVLTAELVARSSSNVSPKGVPHLRHILESDFKINHCVIEIV